MARSNKGARDEADEIERIIREYGEERFAKRISNAICVMRNAKKINTTLELKEIIEKAIPTWKKRESLARVFQSLRIAVNSELENLEKALKDAVDLLKRRGRIVVLSYHSLEDRIVKRAFRDYKKDIDSDEISLKARCPHCNKNVTVFIKIKDGIIIQKENGLTLKRVKKK